MALVFPNCNFPFHATTRQTLASMNELCTHTFSPCDTCGFFFDESGRTAVVPSSLVDANREVNDQAVFSILQFGAIIPHLSPWTGIRRFMPGYAYSGTDMVGPVELRQHSHVRTLNAEQQANEVENLLDAILNRQIGEKRDPVLLFSGGVDSGIIASRLAALGYDDSLLVNYSFGDDDRESKLAEAMAGQLGLRYERVSAHHHLCTCLLEPGRIYPQPFGDHSTVPTSDMAYAVVERLAGEGRVILDGTARSE